MGATSKLLGCLVKSRVPLADELDFEELALNMESLYAKQTRTATGKLRLFIVLGRCAFSRFCAKTMLKLCSRSLCLSLRSTAQSFDQGDLAAC